MTSRPEGGGSIKELVATILKKVTMKRRCQHFPKIYGRSLEYEINTKSIQLLLIDKQ